MKLSKPLGESTMAIIVDYQPEIRFTPGGQRLASWHAKDMRNLIFQQWEEGYQDMDRLKRLSTMQLDTGEYEGTVSKLLELPVNAPLLVVGLCKVQNLRNHTGDKVAVNYFTVRDWTYAGWEWKTRNQPLGMEAIDEPVS